MRPTWRNIDLAALIEVLNRARAMELQAIHQYMNQHYNLGDTYLAKIAETSSSTGLGTRGFAAGDEGA